MNLRALLIPALLGLGLPAPPATAAPVTSALAAGKAREAVVLLHGLGRSRVSMHRLERHLRREGYHVINRTYPSRRAPIEALAAGAIPPALEACREAGCARVHFVTHSMGGILLRSHLASGSIDGLGRVVMLAPPHGGSEVVDRLRDRGWFRGLLGPASLQLGTGVESLPRRLGPARFPLGIIAGTRSWNLWNSRHLPGPDDGKVTVASTRLAGMGDHLVLDVTHTFMPCSPRVAREVVAFLREGRFSGSLEGPRSPGVPSP